MTCRPEHIAASTCHSRRNGPGHAFRYDVDYVLIDPKDRTGPALFSRNRANLAAVHDRNHGGAPGRGRGLAWAQEVFAARGLGDVHVLLLTQPRILGYVFNPVSFWLAHRDGALVAVIAEVNNTYGDRHSYFCATPDRTPIGPQDRITVEKLMHVSPFQDMTGVYTFQFNIRPDRIAIRIDYRNGDAGLVATLTGQRRPLTNGAILAALCRRPAGALRTVVLIYWQALRLKLKGAGFRARPTPPNQEVS